MLHSYPFRSHAPALAAQGWEVFPTAPRGKAPLAGSHGHLDATSDPSVVARWARQHPDSNIGLRPSEGHVVLDLDHAEQFRAWMDERGLTIPPTRTVRTGRGWHYYAKVPAALSGRPLVARLPGLDLKSSRSYVLAPGSIAKTGRIYRVVRDLPVATLPDAWTEHLARPTRPRQHGASPKASAPELSEIEIIREGQAMVRHFAIRQAGSGRRAALQGYLFGVHQRLGGHEPTIEALIRVAVEVHGKNEADIRRLASWVAEQHTAGAIQ
ncbi:bifunctional DNA primase/polymerase [Rhodococcus rhodochrous]|uniref:bifunctional DNA primase/polymerase n=1 Tax=Rhodococcus rhodochrous TaxID=1829 RepID=UPI001D01EA40|nr:bifunctional DNA primase/polymerase [Rhodococcus rhodochrous]